MREPNKTLEQFRDDLSHALEESGEFDATAQMAFMLHAGAAYRDMADGKFYGAALLLINLGRLMSTRGGERTLQALEEKRREASRRGGKANAKTDEEKALQYVEWKDDLDAFLSDHPNRGMVWGMRQLRIPRTRYYAYKKVAESLF